MNNVIIIFSPCKPHTQCLEKRKFQSLAPADMDQNPITTQRIQKNAQKRFDLVHCTSAYAAAKLNPEVIRNSTKSCYTAVFCGTAAGEILPPYFFLKPKTPWSYWLAGAPPGSRMTVTKSGWIDLDSFDDWFKYHFLPFAIKKEKKTALQHSSKKLSIRELHSVKLTLKQVLE